MKSPERFTREETKGQKGEGKMGNEREGVSYDTSAMRNENKRGEYGERGGMREFILFVVFLPEGRDQRQSLVECRTWNFPGSSFFLL